jgi:seryl-tRNA synthetase
MHDIKFIREETAAFVAGLKRRGLAGAEGVAADLLARDRELRETLNDLQQKQARRNEASKLIGQAKAKKDEAGAAALMAEVAGLKDAIQAGEQKERDLGEALKQALAVIPNLPAEDVPDGAGEDDNKPIAARAFGKPPAIGDAKDHVALGEALGQMDFERAARVSGARFVYLKGDLAKLERALGAFMLDTHTNEFGYQEVSPPVLVRDEAMFGTGQLPKFEEDLFSTDKALDKLGNFLKALEIFDPYKAEQVVPINKGEAKYKLETLNQLDALSEQLKFRDRFWLIPTAEVPLTNYVREEILSEAELPLRFTALTPCFRAEAGAAGKDTRGMIRMHQFSKVELVSITTPEQSNAEHERMTDAAQTILKRLDLAHRVMTLCTGDMGFGAHKTYDIEVWLPGQNRFREISSCSNCGEFQARRMNTRWRGADGKIKGPVHTLNGSGLAVGRTLVAILENYQQPNGSIAIPDALRSYMGGKASIAKA